MTTPTASGLQSPQSSDLEAVDEKQGTHDQKEQPHYPPWQWVLTLIGLYLGALLYGAIVCKVLPVLVLT